VISIDAHLVRTESAISTATNERAGICGAGFRFSRSRHQRSFHAGKPERRDSSAQLQPLRSCLASQAAIFSGSCRVMPGILPQAGRPWDHGHHRTVTFRRTTLIDESRGVRVGVASGV